MKSETVFSVLKDLVRYLLVVNEKLIAVFADELGDVMILCHTLRNHYVLVFLGRHSARAHLVVMIDDNSERIGRLTKLTDLSFHDLLIGYLAA